MRLAVVLLIAAVGLIQPQEISHTTSPKVIHKVEPEYTKEALAAKIEGVVNLLFVIETDGTPSNIEVLRGLGKGLDEKAVECLQQWRFSPATNHGEPVSAKATVEMNFRMPRSANSK
jgi:protein TonB